MMRKTLLTLTLALVLGIGVAAPAPVTAQSRACLESCDEDFPGTGHIETSMRGWCYIIRCVLMPD
ncbi:MAG: hypothetical protein ACRELD_08995 [Longimicrobiales bacterium]